MASSGKVKAPKGWTPEEVEDAIDSAQHVRVYTGKEKLDIPDGAYFMRDEDGNWVPVKD